jgi:hypothetical protein
MTEDDADPARQAIKAGLVDELHLFLLPVAVRRGMQATSTARHRLANGPPPTSIPRKARRRPSPLTGPAHMDRIGASHALAGIEAISAPNGGSARVLSDSPSLSVMPRWVDRPGESGLRNPWAVQTVAGEPYARGGKRCPGLTPPGLARAVGRTTPTGIPAPGTRP